MVSGYAIGSYRLGQTLGVGTFGKVKLAVHEGTELNVAVKIVNKMKMQSMDMHEKVRREIAILQCLHHPHVIRLYELIDTPTDIFMVMEYVPGGELFDYIVQHSRLQEPEARKFFQQIVSGVEYCHHHAVCHRDLKPENILLDANLKVKVGDFGLSNFMRDGDFLRTSCGSPNYASPEVVSGKPYAGPEVDVWSCAVILYALLCGSLPFDDEHVPNLFKKIKHGNFTLPGHLSEHSRSLIVRMLTVDPVKRITFKEIRRHPWFRANLPPSLSSSTSMRLTQCHTGVDMAIIEEMIALGYTVDPDTIVIYPKAGTFPSRNTVAYQLLADRKASQKFASMGEGTMRHPPFSFNRESQKRVAAAAMVVGPDVTPFHWASENLFTLNQSGPFVSTASPLGSINATTCTPSGYLTQRCPVSPSSRPPYSAGSSMDWSPGSPMWTASRWKLGIESSLESAIIITAILNTLKALNYEWRLVTPFKIRCRALRKNMNQLENDQNDAHDSANGNTDKYRSSSTAAMTCGLFPSASECPVSAERGSGRKRAETLDACRQHRRHSLGIQQDLCRESMAYGNQGGNNAVGDEKAHSNNDLNTSSDKRPHRGSQQHQCPNSVIICIQLFKISAARYLIDVQLFDGPTLVSMAESLWLTSAIYSALTQIQLQDSPGSALPIWSPSTPMLLGTAPFIGSHQFG